LKPGQRELSIGVGHVTSGSRIREKQLRKFPTLTDPQGMMKIENWNCQVSGSKKGKYGNDPSTLDAVSEILKIGLLAVLHVKIGLDNGC